LIFDRSIPDEAECLKSALDFIGAARPHASAVEIFDPQEPTATMLVCVEEASEGCDQ
jgi:hypothetical protein